MEIGIGKVVSVRLAVACVMVIVRMIARDTPRRFPGNGHCVGKRCRDDDRIRKSNDKSRSRNKNGCGNGAWASSSRIGRGIVAVEAKALAIGVVFWGFGSSPRKARFP